MRDAHLLPGDPAPWFEARSSSNPRYHIHVVAGHWIALTFVDSGAAHGQREVVAEIAARSSAFDDQNAGWFIVTADPMDEMPERLPLRQPGIRAFFDFDRKIHRLYNVASWGTLPVTIVLSPRLTIVGTIGGGTPLQHAETLARIVAAQPPITKLTERFGPPPITIIPNVLEPTICRQLIARYDQAGGEPSGVMREQGGKTVGVFDSSHKVRRDWPIPDAETQAAIQERFARRVAPEMWKAFNFRVSHMERHIVSCYDAQEGGHFNPHRDNTTTATAHRRFACSLNLNSEDYAGGDLCFPEYGPQTYRPPSGGCVIFSCSLLHQATLVTSGKRYAFLPFLHDASAAAVRKANAEHIESAAETHRASSGQAVTSSHGGQVGSSGVP
jgi:predicted 2-oxoglutarate/Fe(II)-dependent dioxygenase YbiX